MTLKRITVSEQTPQELRVQHVVAIEGIFEGLYKAIRATKAGNKRNEFDKTAKNNDHAWTMTYGSAEFNKTISSLKEIIEETYLEGDISIKKNSGERIADKSNWIAYDGKIVFPKEGIHKFQELMGSIRSGISQAMPNIKFRQDTVAKLKTMHDEGEIEEYLQNIPTDKKNKKGFLGNARLKEVRGVPGSSGPWFPNGWSDKHDTPLAMLDSKDKKSPEVIVMSAAQAKQFAKDYIEYLDFAKDMFEKINSERKRVQLAAWDDSDFEEYDLSNHDWLWSDHQKRYEAEVILFDVRTLLAYTVMGYYRYLMNAAPV